MDIRKKMVVLDLSGDENRNWLKRKQGNHDELEKPEYNEEVPTEENADGDQ